MSPGCNQNNPLPKRRFVDAPKTMNDTTGCFSPTNLLPTLPKRIYNHSKHEHTPSRAIQPTPRHLFNAREYTYIHTRRHRSQAHQTDAQCNFARAYRESTASFFFFLSLVSTPTTPFVTPTTHPPCKIAHITATRHTP